MKKTAKIGLAIIMMMAMVCFMGCQNGAGEEVKGEIKEESAVKDTAAVNDAVELNKNRPERVAALSESFAKVWLLSGGELAAVTEDAYDEGDLELGEEVIHLGALKSPDMEKIIEAEIDLVLLSSKIAEHVELEDTLKKAGIRYLYFEVETFEDYLGMLKVCCDITGNQESYEKNGLEVKEKIEKIIAGKLEGEQPKVLLIRAFSTGAKAKGSDNMTGIMLKDLGCTNIADSENSLLEDLNMEKIIEQDPDFIFVTTMGSSDEKALERIAETLISNPAWKDLSAVKNDCYIVLPKELFHLKPNERWAESYEILADILYGAN